MLQVNNCACNSKHSDSAQKCGGTIVVGPARFFRDAELATFLDRILENWVLKLREAALHTPAVPGMS